MTVIVGDRAVINTATTVRSWLVDYMEDERPYAASNTLSGTDRQCGVIDWKGFYDAYGGLPTGFPRDALTFAGEASESKGASGTAIVERIEIFWDQERNDYLSHKLHFAGNGALALEAQDLEDTSVPSQADVVCSSDLAVEIDDVALTDVRRAYLDIRAMHGKPPGQIGNRPYASSSTSGQVRRIAGRLDWNLWVDCYVSDADYSALESLGAGVVWKLYTTGSKYWQLTWGRITRLANIGGNPEDVELVGVRIYSAMQGFSGTSTGTIINPDSSRVWPA